MSTHTSINRLNEPEKKDITYNPVMLISNDANNKRHSYVRFNEIFQEK